MTQNKHIKYFGEDVKDIIDGAHCPIDISVIPNYMGINLNSVKRVFWAEQEDGQLIFLSIQFIPSNE